MLVQGAGGNISWKDDEILWIKASGTWLANAKEKDIFTAVDLFDLQREVRKGNYSVTPKLKRKSLLRPSIETILHALMPHKIVLHIHAIEPLSYLVRADCEQQIKNKITADISWEMVSYQKPGEALAKAVAEKISKAPDTKILLLQNHGIVIGGSDIKEIEKFLTQLLSMLKLQPFLGAFINENPAPILITNGKSYIPVPIPGIHNLAFSHLFKRLRTDWGLYPDHVVFLGPEPICYDSVSLLIEDIEKGNSPELVFLKEIGVYSKPEFSVAKQLQLQCYYEVLIRQPQDVLLHSLDKQQISELIDWEAEKYRQLISK